MLKGSGATHARSALNLSFTAAVVITREMNCDCWNVVKMVPEEPRPSSAESGRQRLRNACGA